MEDKNLRKSLLSALQWASIRELPPVDNGEEVWLLALALASKKDGSKCYVALRKDKNGNDAVVKDFGSVSLIVKIEEVYPYIYLDASFLPEFKGNKKEDRIKWLLSNMVDGNLEELTVKELNKKILCVAINNQLRTIKK